MDESLKLIVEKIKKIPTIPVVAHEILSLIRDDLVAVNKLEKIVQNDPAISAKIMSVANSAFYGYKTPAKTLDNAILRIGFDSVKNIALGISLLTVLGDGKDKRAMDYQRVFNHSVSVGFIAGVLLREFRLDINEEIFINGILHDIGYMVMNRYFPKTYLEVMEAFEKGGPLLDAEDKSLGFTHADIGCWLAEKWNLPRDVSETIMYHHRPSLAKRFRNRVAVIHIADYIATKFIMSPTEKDPDYPFDYSTLEVLGISVKDLREVEEKICGANISEELFI